MTKRNLTFVLAVMALAMALSGCTQAAATTQAPAPTAALNTPTPPPPTEPPPTATEPPPTATEPPPTETPVPLEPIVINEDQLADDGCPIVELNPEAWGPLSAAYNATSDPFYQFHTNEDDFFFNVELYTVYGPSWTGQLGTFVPNCNGNGICVYVVPDAVNPYWATAGEVNIVSLAQENGQLSGPVEISMSNLTMKPVPGGSSQGCYHIEEITLQIGD